MSLAVLQAQLPALQVVVPLMGALVVALLRGPAAAGVAVAVGLACPAIAALLLVAVETSGPFGYALGDWPAPVGIEYRVDRLSAYVLVLVSAMTAVAVIYAPRSIASEIAEQNRGWYFAMLLLCSAGLLGMTISADAFNIFVFMEISSLATYVLIAMGRERRALFAAFQYLIIGTIGATFYVIGVGILLAAAGTLNLAELGAFIRTGESARPVTAALGFIMVGLGLKAALFPLHLWLPNAYAFAPSVASAFVASTATKVALYLMARFIFDVWDGARSFAADPAGPVLMAAAVAAMLGGSVIAIYQRNFKRMLAYSSVAQVGYIVLGFALLSPIGLAGGVAHVFNHAIVKGALFLVAGCLVFSTGITKIADMAGLGRTMPVTMTAFVAAGLGLIGVPGTAGFTSKWLLIQGAAEQGLWWIVIVIVVSSVMAVLYLGRVVEVAWFRPAASAAAAPRPVPGEMLAMTVLLALAVLYFGFDTRLPIGVASDAARTLMLPRVPG